MCYRVWVTCRVRADTGMGKVLYPYAGTSAITGKLFLSGCRYGMAIPVGYVPVAISGPARPAAAHAVSFLLPPSPGRAA
jgi:hypothetical protein